ncbi:GAF domain-containing protein [Streptomyces sp. NPDC004539]|uniref:GAF domain-containing protein n=1 Tax=Streptomyces sp. NPDC004539 TaxID=3154280 RepID=UPI00339DBB06
MRLDALLAIGTDLELATTVRHIVDAAAELTGSRSAVLETGPCDAPVLHVPVEGYGRLHLAGGRPSPALDVLAARASAALTSAHLYEAARQRERWIEGAAAVTTALLGSGSSSDPQMNAGPLTTANSLTSAGLQTTADPDTSADPETSTGPDTSADPDTSTGPDTSARPRTTADAPTPTGPPASATSTPLTTIADPLMTVADRARLLADAAAGVVLQPTAEGGMEIVAASTYDDPGDIVGTTIRPGSALLVQLLGGEPVFIDDSATDPRMTTHVRHRFGPSMMLPLQADGRLIGTLALPRRHGGRPYTETEKRLAVQFTSQAAVALLLADARHRRERLAVYEDRDRIARDLHDLVIQRLFATGMMLQATGRRAAGGRCGGAGRGGNCGTHEGISAREDSGEGRDRSRRAQDAVRDSAEGPAWPPSGDARARDAIDTAVAELEATVQQIRTAIFRLQQPPAEPPSGLRARLLREAAATLGTQPSVRFTGPVDALIPDHLAPTLLTALHDSLTGLTDPDIEVLADGRRGVRLVVDSRVVWEGAVE